MTVEDAVWAVLLLESSSESAFLCGTSSPSSSSCRVNPLHSTFPTDPVSDYWTRAKEVLVSLLGLEDLWSGERRRLQKLAEMTPKVEDGERPPLKTGVDPSEDAHHRSMMTQVVTRLRTKYGVVVHQL